MKYGWLLKLDMGNLGDEIQSIAARRFLPSIDVIIERERPDLPLYAGTEPIKTIFNGWFAHRPEFWPPHRSIEPLLTSFHVSRERSDRSFSPLLPSEALLSGASLDYLRAHAPIGARDVATCELLGEKGVEAYFSGCLTLTLDLFPGAERTDQVYLVDLSDEARQAVARQARSPLEALTHMDGTTTGPWDRVALAEGLLHRYARAKCVVTSRLHCALPCLALGTPVLLVLEQPDLDRFSGLRQLVHHCSREALVAGEADFDFDTPPPNPDDYLTLRQRLISQCVEFIAAETPDRAPSPAPVR